MGIGIIVQHILIVQTTFKKYMYMFNYILTRFKNNSAIIIK